MMVEHWSVRGTGAPPTDTQADAEDVPEITDAADVPEPDDVDGDAEEDADSEETIEEPEDVEDVEDAETTGEVVEDTAEPDEPEDVYTGTEPIDIEPGCTMSDKAVMAPGGDFVDAHAGCTHDCHDDIQFGEGAYSSCVALCMFTELGNFTLECAMCAGLWSWCFESTCLPPCAVSEEDPECIECLETECDVPFDQCIGL